MSIRFCSDRRHRSGSIIPRPGSALCAETPPILKSDEDAGGSAAGLGPPPRLDVAPICPETKTGPDFWGRRALVPLPSRDPWRLVCSSISGEGVVAGHTLANAVD